MTDPGEALLETVRGTGPVDSTGAAQAAVAATMETLGERVTDGQADELAASLPDAAATPLYEASPGEAESFSVPVFLERVAERVGRDDSAGAGSGADAPADDRAFAADPLTTTRVAVAGVREVADPGTFERTREQLPAEYDLLLDPGEPTTAEAFLDRVAAGLPDDVGADVATEAVLAVLGDRLTGGQAGDVATYLPRAVRDPLSGVDEDAAAFDPEEFRDRVAARIDGDAGNAKAAAEAAVRAVVDTLADTAAAREFENVRSQLPREYDDLFEG